MNQEDLSKLFDVDTSGMGDDGLVGLRSAVIRQRNQKWVHDRMVRDLLVEAGDDAVSMAMVEMSVNLGKALAEEMEEMALPLLLAIDMESTAAQVMDGFTYEEVDSREQWERYVELLGKGVESYRQSVELMRPVWNDVERMDDEEYSKDTASEWLLLSNDERYTGTLMVLGGLMMIKQASSGLDMAESMSSDVGMFMKRVIRLYFRLFMSFSVASSYVVDRKWDKG